MQGNVSFWASAIHIFQVGPSSYQTYSNLFCLPCTQLDYVHRKDLLGCCILIVADVVHLLALFFVCAIYMLKSSKFIQQHKQLMF